MNLSIFSAAATTGTYVTMTSGEISDLTDKQHKHVLDEIRKMLEDLGQTSAGFSADLPDSYGRLQPAYNLPKRETQPHWYKSTFAELLRLALRADEVAA